MPDREDKLSKALKSILDRGAEGMPEPRLDEAFARLDAEAGLAGAKAPREGRARALPRARSAFIPLAFAAALAGASLALAFGWYLPSRRASSEAAGMRAAVSESVRAIFESEGAEPPVDAEFARVLDAARYSVRDW